MIPDCLIAKLAQLGEGRLEPRRLGGDDMIAQKIRKAKTDPEPIPGDAALLAVVQPHSGRGSAADGQPKRTKTMIMEAAPQADQRQTQQHRRRDAGRRHASFRDLKNLSVDDWCALFRIDRSTIDAGARVTVFASSTIATDV